MAMTAEVLDAAPPVDMAALAAHYTFRNPEEVRRFLEKRSYTVPLLLEALDHVRRIFGPEASLQLRLSVDPEYPQDAELFTLIRTDISTDEKFEEANRKIRRLYSEWLIDLPRPLTRHMNFDLEYS